MTSLSEDQPFVSSEKGSDPKRIIVCCDGTWQDSLSLDPKAGVSSNVTRLCRALANAGTDRSGRTWDQLIYYDAGVGTGEITNVDQARQGGLGIGLDENVLEAYNFVVNNYQNSDELFFFGFSRGAYTARAAAGLVATLGVLKPSSMSAFIQIYAQYKRAPEGRPKFTQYPAWIKFTEENPNYAIEKKENAVIQVIGVWDTVGSLGIPELGHFWTIRKADTKYYEFYDTDLSDSIKHAFQALALDEQRPAFVPTVWKVTNNNTTKLSQCWFPGAHVNIGGGNSDNNGPNPTGDSEQLATIAYAWMLDRIRPYLAFDDKALDEQFSPFAKQPPPGVKGVWGYARGIIDESFKGFYWLMTFPKPRTPNRYHDPSKGEVTQEHIHPSVHYRQLSNLKNKEPTYEPAAMKGWKRTFEQNGKDANGQSKKGWMWVKYKDDRPNQGVENSLWEFEIGHMPADKSLEKRLIDQSWVSEVKDEVQDSWKGLKSNL